MGCEKPTIAKVFAPGAHSLGASVALACDFVYAADDATFCDPHLSGFAVPPGDGGALLWPSRIGLTRAREFLMTDKVCTAQEAVDIGLINRAVPADELDGEVAALVEKLLSFDPFALHQAVRAARPQHGGAGRAGGRGHLSSARIQRQSAYLSEGLRLAGSAGPACRDARDDAALVLQQ